jgi:membrane associated rhomboid family serine protease
MSEVLGFDETLLRVGSYLALALAVLVAALVLSRLGDYSRLLAGPRERFVYGVPWGTLVTVAVVVAIYYGLQGGGKPGGPIITGFRSWSLWYPQGILLSSFAHFSDGHLVGNMTGTVVFAPLAEYIWGHYPDQPKSGWRGDPRARIAVFVAAVGLVGILGSIVVPGAVIGFSGVVFAFAGFTIITAPVGTIFAIVGLGVVRLAYRALTDPVLVARSQEQFVRPSWANIAVQGHLYGLVVGVVLGVALLQYRRRDPRYYAVFAAALVFSVSRSLQSVYWFLGNETYVLLTALGAAGVVVLATIVAVAAGGRDGLSLPVVDVPARRVAVGVLLLVVVGLALVGIPYNLAQVDGGPATERGATVEVRDYTVTYAESVEDQYISAVGLPGVGGPSVTRSGVIVVSDRRNSWGVAASTQQLAVERSTTLALGDATWRETVTISRTGWNVAGENATYVIDASHDGQQTRLYADEPAVANLRLDGRAITIRPAAGGFEVVVTDDGTRVGAQQIPAAGERISIDGIEFARDGRALLAAHDQTVLQVAEYRP